MRYRAVLFAALAGTLPACATSGPPSRYPDIDTTVLGQATDPNLAGAIYEEATELERIAFRSRDGLLSGRVLATSRPVVKPADDGFEIEIEIGGAAPVRCLVRQGVLGVSAFARDLAEAYLFSYAAHELKYVFAGAPDGRPMVIVHGQYIEPGGAARRTGFFKTVVVGRAEQTVACLHDELGYRQTLERVAVSLLDDLELVRGEKPLLPLVHRAVYTIRQDGEPTGAREVVIRADEEGFRQTWVRTTFLRQRSKQRVEARDVIETQESDPDGLVMRQTFQVREDGAPTADLELEEGPMPAYEVRGTLDDAEARARFTVADGLFDLVAAARARRVGRAHPRYRPELDASAAVEAQVTAEGDGVRVVEGDRVVTGRIDAAGYWISGTSPNGFTFERTDQGP